MSARAPSTDDVAAQARAAFSGIIPASWGILHVAFHLIVGPFMTSGPASDLGPAGFQAFSRSLHFSLTDGTFTVQCGTMRWEPSCRCKKGDCICLARFGTATSTRRGIQWSRVMVHWTQVLEAFVNGKTCAGVHSPVIEALDEFHYRGSSLRRRVADDGSFVSGLVSNEARHVNINININIYITHTFCTVSFMTIVRDRVLMTLVPVAECAHASPQLARESRGRAGQADRLQLREWHQGIYEREVTALPIRRVASAVHTLTKSVSSVGT